MLDIFPEVISLGIGLLLSAFYSGSEAALISISVDRVKQLIEEGGQTGKALDFLSRKSNEMLTTILVGNNLVNIFTASMATQLISAYFDEEALSISVGLTTFFILVFGEIIPKTFSRTHAEKMAVPVIRILQVNYFVFYPIVKMFVWAVDKILGENARLTGRIVSRSDIEFLVSKAEREQSIDAKHLGLLSSILEFPKIKVKDIVIPRDQVKFILIGQSIDEIEKLVNESAHSRYPVCETGLDDVVGFLHVKELLFRDNLENEGFNLKGHLKNPFFVYEHMKIQSVFDHMNRKKVHLALVKDENGIVVGIVTLEDIIEEIMGEIQDEHDEDSPINVLDAKPHGEIVIEGRISIRDLASEHEIKIPMSDRYSTLDGFILSLMGDNFPKKGMMIIWNNYSFKIERVEADEIKSVCITKIDQNPPANDGHHN